MLKGQTFVCSAARLDISGARLPLGFGGVGAGVGVGVGGGEGVGEGAAPGPQALLNTISTINIAKISPNLILNMPIFIYLPNLDMLAKIIYNPYKLSNEVYSRGRRLKAEPDSLESFLSTIRVARE